MAAQRPLALVKGYQNGLFSCNLDTDFGAAL